MILYEQIMEMPVEDLGTMFVSIMRRIVENGGEKYDNTEIAYLAERLRNEKDIDINAAYYLATLSEQVYGPDEDVESDTIYAMG